MACARSDAGFAILTVLMVLMALLVMVAPFLLTVRNANSASSELADRADARVALDSAARHARAVLRETHIARDDTPYFDSLEELLVDTEFDDDFLKTDDPNGVMWDVEARDLSGYIDLNSAPPHLIANLTGLVARASRPVQAEDTELPVSGADAFPEAGFLWVAGERIAYAKREPRVFADLTRGLLADSGDGEEGEQRCGPRAPQLIPAGTVVYEQKAWAPAEWRVAVGNSGAGLEPGRIDALDQLEDIETFAMSQELGAEFGDVLRATCALKGDGRAGPRWQRATRVNGQLSAGETCELNVADSRWFNPGTTVQLTDGRQSELALVLSVGVNQVVLTEAVRWDYRPYQAELRPLARRPVNINTAPAEVLRALFENLKLRNVNSRITASEAMQLVEVVLESRPFEGFEDFVERLVLPAGGIAALPNDAPVIPAAFEGDAIGLIDEDDARALYLNALNANDRSLEFSTMPISFSSRDVFALELRSAVNAKSGVARVGLARDDVELVVPQERLMHLWSRQEDFDLALRLEREAPYWATGPEATSQYDGRTSSRLGAPSTPPSRATAHLGERDPISGQQLRAHASRSDDDGFAKLATARVAERQETLGRIEHFDRERTNPEGRDTTEAPYARSTTDRVVGWRDTADGGFLRPLQLSFWLKPLANLVDGQLLFDLGASNSTRAVRDELQSDRISLTVDDGDLVLRVHDGSRDHPGTSFREVAEVRYPLAGAGAPGVPTDTWTHVDIDVRGNRPSQMSMIVDGRMATETPGLTRLTDSLAETATRINVESTEGFPASCVLRIGNEIIEAQVTGETTLEAIPGAERQGRGGRLARGTVAFKLLNSVSEDPVPISPIFFETQHAAGTPVELYGYSVPVAAQVNDYSEPLRAGIGPFRVARVTGAVQGDNENPTVTAEFNFNGVNFRIPLGRGFVSELATTLRLGAADRTLEGMSATEVERWVSDELMPAFSPEGGFAAIVQPDIFFPSATQNYHVEPSNGRNYQLGGISLVRYTGIDREEGLLFLAAGTAVNIPVGTNHSFPSGNAVTDGDNPIGPAAFVTGWNGNFVTTSDNVPLSAQRRYHTFVFPISLPTRSAGSLGLLNPEADQDPAFRHSELAQIAPAGATDPQATEWVRYDELVPGHLVRSDPRYLRAAQRAAQAGLESVLGASQPPDEPDPPNPPGGPGGPGNPGNPGQGGGGGVGVPPGGGGAPPPPQQSFLWSPLIGQADFTDSDGVDLPISRAVASALQFRGVFGTFAGDHAAGERLQPVFRLNAGVDDRNRVPSDPDGDIADVPDLPRRMKFSEFNPGAWGLPGAGDRAFLMGTPTDALNFAGTEVVLQHVHQPFQHLVYGWEPVPNELHEAQSHSELEAYIQLVEMQNWIWFSLETPVAFPPLLETDGENETDMRRKPRLTLFPSGELPRATDRMTLGGRFDQPGADGAALLVDEVVFGDTVFGSQATAGASAAANPSSSTGSSSQSNVASAGASFILRNSIDESATIFEVVSSTIRRDTMFGSLNALNAIPPNGGLLRIGEELMAYVGVQAGQGLITLPQNGGRGLLGTTAQPHEGGESVTWLEGYVVSTLSAAVSSESSALPLVDASRFPSRGTVRVGDELVHYTRIEGGALAMPQASEEVGEKDSQGRGLFRGRYGTGAQGHAFDTPVILHPFRYWDRWADRADVPELAYFGFGVSQPGAFWTSAFWQEEPSGHGGPRLGVLQRSDPRVPWDAVPNSGIGLSRYLEGQLDKGGNPIGEQSGRVDWRVYVTYDPGSFDAALGLSHGWKTTPVLRLFGAECFAPGQTLRSVER